MFRMFHYRLYPSRKQKMIIDATLENCRWLYNELLSVKIETYNQGNKRLSEFDLNKEIAYFKSKNKNLKLIHSQVQQNISNRIYKAFKNMFTRIKRGEKEIGFPRFKKRYKSICYPQFSNYVCKFTSDNKLKLSKIGEINIVKHRELKGTIKNLTIKKMPSGKYFAIFVCEVDKPIIISKPQGKLGIDVGLTSFLTTNEDKHIDNPRYLRKAEERLAILNRKHSKKRLRSKNREKARIRLARMYEKVSNQRYDFIHKLSHYFVNNYGFIALEDLNIQGLVQNPYLSKSINDAGWGLLKYQLQYKAESAGTVIQQVNRFYPSSQLCSDCGNKQVMTLKMRTFTCFKCGSVKDRDHNSATNILNEGWKIYTVGTTEFQACEDVPLGMSEKQEVITSNEV